MNGVENNERFIIGVMLFGNWKVEFESSTYDFAFAIELFARRFQL
jgi:hypothetical protein